MLFQLVLPNVLKTLMGLSWEGPHHTGESNYNIFTYYKDGLSVTENNYIDYSNPNIRDCAIYLPVQDVRKFL